MSSALETIDAAIADLEAKLNLAPGGNLTTKPTTAAAAAAAGGKQPNQKQQDQQQQQQQPNSDDKNKAKKEKKKTIAKPQKAKNAPANVDQPDICKLEFKVGRISKVWVHPEADKLYCEEIECGEDKPRQIASGLRPHYSLEEMQGRRLLVVSNLKTKKLAGFPSAGMVLCAAETKEDGSEIVEFVEPPEGAPLGEIITFEGLPPPEPFSGAQVEKKKVFNACADGMKTTEDGIAAWNGHVFMTSAGPCRSETIKNGSMR
jgi:aminoacyl tRNA synthase complex-interacting multifunctional protein 1